MNAFWREEALNESESKLLTLCLEAHSKSAMRSNFSSVAVAQSAAASGDFTKAITAGLSMLGGMHAPLAQSWEVLTGNMDLEFFFDGGKVPGWGNSFEKCHPDPLWGEVSECLKEHFPKIHSRICEITDALHKDGKVVFPNPSCFTAAVGLALKMEPKIIPWIFVSGRLNAWAYLFIQQTCADKSCHTSKEKN